MTAFRFRLYAAELGGALLLYTGLLAGRNWLDAWLQPQGVAQTAIALLPVPGCAAIVLAVFRFAVRLDEMQRRIHFEAAALAFTAIAFGAFAWPFVLDAGVPPLPEFALAPIVSACWGAGVAIATWRHR